MIGTAYTIEFVEIEGNLYQILRKIREDTKPVIDTWKEHLNSDKVFKRDGIFFFCRLVEEATIEEIIPEEEKIIDENDK